MAIAETLRAETLQALNNYEITPIISTTIPSLRYINGGLEFLHECHDLGDHLMRVVDDSVYLEAVDVDLKLSNLPVEEANKVEVIDGMVRIDTVDDWESQVGRFAALLYDPRWLIKRLEDLTVIQEGSNSLLRGNFYHGRHKFGSNYSEDLLEQPKEVILTRLQGSLRAGQNLRELSEQDLKDQQMKMERYEKLEEQELKETIRTEALNHSWEFLVTVDERSLPTLVRTTAPNLLELLSRDGLGEGIRFQYIPKVNTSA